MSDKENQERKLRINDHPNSLVGFCPLPQLYKLRWADSYLETRSSKLATHSYLKEFTGFFNAAFTVS